MQQVFFCVGYARGPSVSVIQEDLLCQLSKRTFCVSYPRGPSVLVIQDDVLLCRLLYPRGPSYMLVIQHGLVPVLCDSIKIYAVLKMGIS